MISEIGAPQIAALLILIQRGAEEIHSARNTRALLARGAREEGADYYPVVAVAHLSWIASLFLLVPQDAHTSWPLIGLFVVLQAVRYWSLRRSGRTGHIASSPSTRPRLSRPVPIASLTTPTMPSPLPRPCCCLWRFQPSLSVSS